MLVLNYNDQIIFNLLKVIFVFWKLVNLISTIETECELKEIS